MNANINVSPAALSKLVLQSTLPNPATAGSQFFVTVEAEDFYSNQETGDFNGLTFSSTDPQAVLPTGSSMSGGFAVNLPFTLKTAGNSQRITITDNGVSINLFVNVVAAGTSKYVVSAVDHPGRIPG